ncbi:MAG TPA: hypothetical protein PKE39_14620 [Ignavibacteria bacterium]|nr:hypothetical protein [Ignavibacteria bacterium]HMR00253.1 hypothetical protein [Ignavibacteria bacterium]
MKALVLKIFLAIHSLIYCEPVMFDKHPISEECSVITESYIKIYISLDTNYYFYGEPVWLTVRVVNESNKVDSIADLYEGELLPNVIINKGSGGGMEYKGLIGCFGKRTYSIFLPGEKKTFYFELRSVYGNESAMNEKTVFGLWNIFEPDSYSLCIKKYEPDSKNVIRSNYIYFNVVLPHESEALVLSRLQEIYDMQDYDIEKANKKKAAFLQLLPEVTQSRYYKEAFSRFISLSYFYPQNDFDKIAGELYMFMDSFPDDYLSRSHIWHYNDAFIKNEGTKQSVLIELGELKKKHPDTRLSSEIEYFLKLNQ